jgi:hypothetical protein
MLVCTYRYICPKRLSPKFTNFALQKNSKVLEKKLFLKEVQSARTSIINYVLDLT